MSKFDTDEWIDEWKKEWATNELNANFENDKSEDENQNDKKNAENQNDANNAENQNDDNNAENQNNDKNDKNNKNQNNEWNSDAEDTEWEKKEYENIDIRKLAKMARQLSENTIRRFLLIESNIKADTLTIEQILINLSKFIKLIQQEKIDYVLEGYKEARVWIFQNMFRALNKRLINPRANEEICTYLESKYYIILDIYAELNEINEMNNGKENDNTEDISDHLYAFFIFDTTLKLKSQSKFDITSYILNNNIYLLFDGKTIGSMQSKD